MAPRWIAGLWGVALAMSAGCRPTTPATPTQAPAPTATHEDGAIEDSEASNDEPELEPSEPEVSVSAEATAVSAPTHRIDGGRLESHPLAPFELDRTEVTVGAYRACVEAGACSAPEPTFDRGNYHREGHEDHPVTHVRADQAEEFCAWVGKRLPTEWEWQWAAQGGTRASLYPWGNAEPTCDLAAFDDPSVSVTEKSCGRHGPWPVGSRPKGANPDGVLDLAGNVREWTASPGEPGKRIVRGGGWFMRASALEVRKRDGIDPTRGSNGVGFRCARSAE